MMSFSPSQRILSLLGAVLLIVPATAQEAQIVLKAAATCQGPIIRLGDVAELSIEDPQQRQALQQVELLAAPTEEQSVYLTINDVRSALAARGFSDLQFTLTGPSRVYVESIAASHSTEKAPTSGRPSRRTFGGRLLPQEEPEVVTVAHVVRNIRRGEVIRASDVELRPLTLVRQDEEFPEQLDNVIGKEATRSLVADRPIPRESLREPVVVHRNDVVTVMAMAGNVLVRREMLALQDAGMDELVEVQPLTPQRRGRARQAERFQAQVTGPGEAIVLSAPVQVEMSPASLSVTSQEPVE